jgi:hypothetical protein
VPERARGGKRGARARRRPLARLLPSPIVPALRDPALRARIVDVTELRFVRAGSSLVAAGGRLLVVQDDALAVAWVDPRTKAIEHVSLKGFGGPLPKSRKPDFEAAFVDRDGRVVVLGSGSTPARRRAARLDPATQDVVIEDWAPLFDALGAALGGTPNVEGATRVGDALALLHRGAGGAPSAVATIAMDDVNRPGARVSVAWHDLGALDGVALGFTDGEAVGDALVYVAAAEDTTNAVDDGRVAGTAVGVIARGEARFAVLEEPGGAPSTRKAEGIALVGAGEAFVVTDPDDAARPAELCRVALEGFPSR